MFWKKTESGRNIPVNPLADGSAPPGALFDPKTMVTHYVTCPKASEFRGKGGRKQWRS